jgi:hypothetical protein
LLHNTSIEFATPITIGKIIAAQLEVPVAKRTKQNSLQIILDDFSNF